MPAARLHKEIVGANNINEPFRPHAKQKLYLLTLRRGHMGKGYQAMADLIGVKAKTVAQWHRNPEFKRWLGLELADSYSESTIGFCNEALNCDFRRICEKAQAGEALTSNERADAMNYLRLYGQTLVTTDIDAKVVINLVADKTITVIEDNGEKDIPFEMPYDRMLPGSRLEGEDDADSN